MVDKNVLLSKYANSKKYLIFSYEYFNIVFGVQ